MNTEMKLEKFAAQLDMLRGETLATQVALQALMACHPEPETARKEVSKALEEAIAMTLATHHASDPLIYGLQSVKQLLDSED